MIAEHRRLRESTIDAPRLLHRAFAAASVIIAGLSTMTCLPAASAAMTQRSCSAFGSER